jgi:serine/threonine protein kinase
VSVVQVGALLKDAVSGEERFRIDSLLTDGKNYQIALAVDTRMDDKQVCVKTIEYSAELLSDAKYIDGRRKALRDELEFITLPSHLLPEPLDWLSLDGAVTGAGHEPVLVYEFQHGENLFDLIKTRHPEGLAPARALRIFAELVRFCGEIHASGYIFRDFDPRHVIVGFDDIFHVVGCGNAVKRGEKMNVYKMNTNPCYTAPEIRHDLSGKVVRPACDFYSLGCLLSFMLTGVETRHLPEAPLDAEAYEKLEKELPAGYRLLVARCLQPLAQKRFATASQLLPFCSPDTLPAENHPDFGMMLLPTPWSGPEHRDNRGVRSKLSPGPLISSRHSPAEGGAVSATPGSPGHRPTPETAPPSAGGEAPVASNGEGENLPAKAEQKDGAIEKRSGCRRILAIFGGGGIVLLMMLALFAGAMANML